MNKRRLHLGDVFIDEMNHIRIIERNNCYTIIHGKTGICETYVLNHSPGRYRTQFAKDEYIGNVMSINPEPESPASEVASFSLNELAKRAHADACNMGWYDAGKVKSDLECLAMVITEVCEAIDELRNSGHAHYYANVVSADGFNTPASKPEGYGVEVADAVIRLLDFAAYKEIDLEKLIDEKLKYNLTRGHRHGSKPF
jgi:NTP pyrophosphatase (non-canonical NTP hydrolase)